jgi:hypothetical protein
MTFWKRKSIHLGDQNVTELTILEWKRFFSIKLFHFHPTDGKQDRFHTHAFNAVSILLSGDYVEEVVTEKRQIVTLKRSRKRFLFIPANQYHRITKSNGCRTLLITGPWGKEFRELREIKGSLEYPQQSVNDWQIVVCGEGRKSLRSEGIVRLENG